MQGIYFEIEVRNLPDLISLCLVYFYGGGTTSFSFNADTGSVIRETNKASKIGSRTTLGVIEGTFATVMPPCINFCRGSTFTGNLAFYISRVGELSFHRKTNRGWDSTGIVCSCHDWVEGERVISPCIAFGREDEYDVRIKRVETAIPLEVQKSGATRVDTVVWSPLNWADDDSDVDDDTDDNIM